MSDINDLVKELLAFREAREWKKFHRPKDMALSLVLEAAELLELFQWKSEKEVEEYVKNNKNKISEELADVFNWVILMSHDLSIDIMKASQNKIKHNHKKYPVVKTKGRYAKYTNL